MKLQTPLIPTRQSIAILFFMTVSLFQHATTTFAFSIPSLSKTPASSSSLHMAKGRRGGLDVGGGDLGGKRPISGGSENDEVMSSGKKGKWVPVSGLKSLSDLPQTTGEIKLIDTMAPSLINKQTNPTGAVSVVKYDGDTTYCFSSSCASCKIPLTKAKILPPNEETTGTDPRLECDFCGATYNVRTGAPVAREGRKLLGFLFSKSETENLPVFALGEQAGKVFINLPQ